MSIESDIESYRERGYGDPSLKKFLRAAGYQDEEIDEALKNTSPQKPTPKPNFQTPIDPYRRKAKQFLLKFSAGLIVLAGLIALFAYHIIPIPQSIVSLENKYLPHEQTQTQQQTQPTATLSVPLGVKPGKCLVVEEKYCNGKEFTFTKTGKKGVGFDLPGGTVVFAPMSGKAIPGIVDGSTIPVITLGVVYDGKPAALSLYNVKTTLRVGTEVKAGQPLGVVASDEKILDAMYNFDITARPAGLSDALYSTFSKK